MQDINNMDAIRLLQHKNFVDVLEHDLVVMRLSMQLSEVGVEIERIVTARNQHRQVLD